MLADGVQVCPHVGLNIVYRRTANSLLREDFIGRRNYEKFVEANKILRYLYSCRELNTYALKLDLL